MRTAHVTDSAIAARRAELDYLQHVVDELRIALRTKEYDPNQPRIPAHQTGAGRWTKDGSAEGIDVTKTDRFKKQLYAASRRLEECAEMNRRDLIVCKFTGLQSCYAQAMVRLVACENGHPIPPLNF